jgi:hypothetical protein
MFISVVTADAKQLIPGLGHLTYTLGPNSSLHLTPVCTFITDIKNYFIASMLFIFQCGG